MSSVNELSEKAMAVVVVVVVVEVKSVVPFGMLVTFV